MADVFLDVLARDATTVTVDLRVADPTGTGFRQIRVLDNAGVDVAPEFPSDPPCPTSVTLHLGTLSRTRLPLTVLITDCGDNEEVITDVGGPPSPVGTDPKKLSCDPLLVTAPSLACSEAQRELAALRGRFEGLCNTRRNAMDHMRDLTIILAINLALVVAMFALAAAVFSIPFVGPAAAVAFFAAAALYFWRAERLGAEIRRLQARIESLRIQIDEIREQFEGKASDVRNACCPEQILVDLRPTC